MTKNFSKSMANVARGYASTATTLAKNYAPNKHLRNSIKSTVEQRGEADFIIRVRASGPDARAREYGSGIWARRGPRGKILIRARNKKALAFYWEKGTGALAYDPATHLPVAGTLPGGIFIGKQVEHPGVEAANEGQGYIHPAIRDVNKLIRKRIAQEAGEGIRADIRASFRTK